MRESASLLKVADDAPRHTAAQKRVLQYARDTKVLIGGVNYRIGERFAVMLDDKGVVVIGAKSGRMCSVTAYLLQLTIDREFPELVSKPWYFIDSANKRGHVVEVRFKR